MCAWGQTANSTPPTGDLPAFPGAEGFGSRTTGGRGGRVIEVTNLNPGGPGSLQAALAAGGPRIVVFRVGGTIHLPHQLTVEEPFVTVAGQTAPGDGVCLRGAGLRVWTHDVVIRHLRVRVGDDPNGPDPGNRDGIGINGRPGKGDTTYNVILDHCSVSWAIDENVELWYPCHDITLQWCIIAEGLDRSLHPKGPHSKGILVGPGPVPGTISRASIHHCLLAHNADRNPLISADTETEIINNVVYNWTWGAGTHLGNCSPEYPAEQPSRCNVIGNYYLTGPSTRSTMGKSIQIDSGWGEAAHCSRVYVKGNVGPGRPSDDGDDGLIVFNQAGDGVRAAEPALKPSGIATQPILIARDLVLDRAGAILPKRDSVDERVVQSVRNRAGKIINSQQQVGGWPEYKNAPPPVDSDRDGMPDEWEKAHRFDPHNPNDGSLDADGDGYTNVEEFLNNTDPKKRD